MGLTTQHWIGFIGLFLLFVWGISIFCFSKITVKHIEREMAKEGKSPPEWDKGIGGRFSLYAMAIVINKMARKTLVDGEAIRRHARKKDWYLAVFFLSSFIAAMSMVGVFYYLYGP
ncbi:hypothetical protein [Thalassomonas sp. RHCl1]|uniref:hypothetical protein n=1 Tax=Thalassomonas sp. RHCl1 TaxID=2995320 RepID=UPI00248C0B33|nr:hypothetical protein [Thalassomonas sp. RHCl1]